MTDTYICVDLETTGLNPKADRIIEIGAIKVVEGVITDTFESFVNPGRLLADNIIDLTGIVDADLKNAPQITQVLPQFLEFSEEYPLLGHSVLFDYSFLKKAAVNQKFTYERLGIDTLKIARKYLMELEHRSLSYLCEYYQIPHQAHRALEDAKATKALYETLIREFGEKEGNAVFLPQKLIYQVKRDTPITQRQKERLYKLLEKHRLSVDYELDKLTKSEASRYTDQILAKFGR